MRRTHPSPSRAAHQALMAELGGLLAKGYLRACEAATARLVAAPPEASASPGIDAVPVSRLPVPGPRNALAERRNREPSCVLSPTARDPRDAAAHGEHA
jgi:hypothetical protein